MNKPNIILIFTDQQRFDSLGSVNPLMKTPNLDRLAAGGCLYKNAYSPNPVCIPARHNILTGLTSKHHGFARNACWPMAQPLPCIPQLLGHNGYHCEAIGKMHFQPMREHHGFHRMQLMEETPAHRQDDDYLRYLKKQNLGNVVHQHGVRHLLYHQPQRSQVPIAHHGTTWVGDRTIEFLQENQKGPFFLWTSFIHPHPPYNVPDEWAHTYDDVDLPDPIAPVAPESLPPLLSALRKLGDGMHEDPARMKRHKQSYYSSIAYVDFQVGRILDELDKQDLAKDTLIIFTTDHGEMLGDLGLYQKSSPFEGSAHIPFIARFPGVIEEGSSESHFVDLNDILPTFIDAAGLSYPGEFELPGESLLTKNPAKNRDLQYAENGWIDYQKGGNRWRMMMDSRYKYTQFHAGGFELLYDLQKDPEERCNLMEGDLSDAHKTAYLYLQQKLIEYELKYCEEKEAVVDGKLSSIPVFDVNGGICAAKSPWVANLQKQDEIDDLNSIEKEMITAVEKEPTVTLSHLSLDEWGRKTGYTELAEKFKKEGR